MEVEPIQPQHGINHHQEEQVLHIGNWNEKKCDHWDAPMLKEPIIEILLLVVG
jgi:hypothetical protein